MFCTFCFCYIYLELGTLNRTDRLLTNRTPKINQSVFFYLHMYANNTHRYFRTVLRDSPKNFSTLSKSVPFLKNRTRPGPLACFPTSCLPYPLQPSKLAPARQASCDPKGAQRVNHTPLVTLIFTLFLALLFIFLVLL